MNDWFRAENHLRHPSDRNGSVYTCKPNDPEAVFFTPEDFNIKADGKSDVSDQLQAAFNKVKAEKHRLIKS